MHSGRKIVVLAATLGVLTGCSQAPVRVQFEPAVPPAIVWPALPDPPRVAFLGEFTTPADVGVAKSTWSKVTDFLAGSAPDALIQPMAVVATAGGERIFIADPGAQVVHLFDRARGRYQRVLLENRQPLPSPVGLALTPEGRLFVTDSQLGRVFVAEPGTVVLRPLQLQESLAQPTGIAFDAATRRLYVAETAAHRISVFDEAGQRVEQIGTRGTGDGEFNYPTYLWLSGDGLAVTDSLNFRIQFFDDKHRFLGRLGSAGSAPGNLPRPKGVAVDHSGHVYVVDALLHDLQVFDRNGALLFALGVQGSQPGEFWLPNGLWIAPDDTIYVADSRNRRVQVFRYVGAKP